MKAQIATVQSKVASLPPVTVFDYDSGTSAPFTGPGLAMPNAEITLGGGTNIFAGLKQIVDVSLLGASGQSQPPVHHHQRLQHPHRRPERAVPGDQPHHQEPRPRSRTGASSPSPTTKSPPAPATPKPSWPSPTGSTPPPSASPPTGPDSREPRPWPLGWRSYSGGWAERAPMDLNHSITFSCRVPRPVAASNAVPWA